MTNSHSIITALKSARSQRWVSTVLCVLIFVAISAVFVLAVLIVPNNPRLVKLLRPMFDLLPGISGYFLAMIGIAVLFVEEYLKRLKKYRRLRLIIALVVFIIGVGAVVSDSLQKQEAKEAATADRNAAKIERDKLMDQIAKLTDAQASAMQEAKSARAETLSVRAELVEAQRQLMGQISKTETVLATNINQYRSDTTSAVARILRPQRSLEGVRADLIKALEKGRGYEVAITIARGCQECLNLGTQIESAFKEAGWKIGKSSLFMITKDATGLFIMVKSMSAQLRPDQMVAGIAFKSIGMQLIGGEVPNIEDKGPVELYVGFQ